MDNTEIVTCTEKGPITDELLTRMNKWWRAANYLSACQLYLLSNPLLKEPLTIDMIKKKIVGHWGTVPGQNFVFVHLNRAIRDTILISFSCLVLAMAGTSISQMITSTALTVRSIPIFLRMKPECRNCSNSSPSPAESPHTALPKLQDPSTRAANSVMA
jgi:hypothetical protein